MNNEKFQKEGISRYLAEYLADCSQIEQQMNKLYEQIANLNDIAEENVAPLSRLLAKLRNMERQLKTKTDSNERERLQENINNLNTFLSNLGQKLKDLHQQRRQLEKRLENLKQLLSLPEDSTPH